MAREIMCHATNLFFEARGEPPLGQRWVLDVVRNRALSSEFRQDTICSVVKKRNQFSWYNDHKEFMPKDPLLWEEYVYSKFSEDPEEMKAWDRSFMMSIYHLLYEGEDITDNSLFYMTYEEYESRGFKPFPKTYFHHLVGNHVFFKLLKERPSCCINF